MNYGKKLMRVQQPNQIYWLKTKKMKKWIKSKKNHHYSFISISKFVFSLRIQEMITSRQTDRQTIQNSERRLAEERRQRQSLESQLNAERKHRKQAEEKAAR